MPSIEETGYPLVFKVANDLASSPAREENQTGQQTTVRAYVRALEGMQKEAVVAFTTETGQQNWRMVCDEGPYLNGTDLAPFPLGFFSAGMQFSILTEILRHAKAQNVTLTALSLEQDNYYTMNGSALRGTMIGGAKPVEVRLKIESDAPSETIAEIVRLAEQSSPAHALMRDVLINSFSLDFNDTPLALADLPPSPASDTKDPDTIFVGSHPDTASAYSNDLIVKLDAADVIEGVEGGASSSLKAEQKRTLRVRGAARWIEGNLMEATAQVTSPIGSNFRFLCEADLDGTAQANDPATATAPPPLAYFSAGVGFCYMTQIGRYAHITKQAMKTYKIIQDNTYVTGDVAQALPFDTRVFIEADESDEVAEKTVSMGERTCFLHAAMRDSYLSQIEIELNGEGILFEED